MTSVKSRMHVRAVLALFVLLSIPVWPSLLGGQLDPDAAALRLVVAGVLAVAVEYAVRTFVSAATPREANPPAQTDPAADEAGPGS